MRKLGEYPNFSGMRSKLTKADDLSPMMKQSTPLLRRNDILTGVEIESELWPARHAQLGKWWLAAGGEGSLKTDQAFEWFTYPLRGLALVRALAKYEQEAKKYDEHFTARCAVHVHINMLEADEQHAASMIALCLLLDNHLYAVSDWERCHNYHCRPLSLAFREVVGAAQGIRMLLRGAGAPAYNQFKVMRDRRYLGVNFASLAKHGTLEFRHFPGEYQSKVIRRWINCLYRIYDYAEKHSLVEIHLLANNGPGEITEQVFGKTLAKHMDLNKVRETWPQVLETYNVFSEIVEGSDESFDQALRDNYLLME